MEYSLCNISHSEAESNYSSHDFDSLLKSFKTQDDTSIGNGNSNAFNMFPNVFSVQKLLLQRSHHSLKCYSSEDKLSCLVKKVTFSEEPVIIKNNSINLQVLERPTNAEKCYDVLQYWISQYTQSGLKKFIGHDRELIQDDVLLNATLGLMTDSETYSAELVDMKWSCFLEGALAQSKSLAPAIDPDLINGIKTLIMDFNHAHSRVIEQNNVFIANRAKHITVIEDSIGGLNEITKKLSMVSDDLQKSLWCSLANLPIMHVPRSPSEQLLNSPSFSICFKGCKLSLFLSPNKNPVIKFENMPTSTRAIKSSVVKNEVNTNATELKTLDANALNINKPDNSTNHINTIGNTTIVINMPASSTIETSTTDDSTTDISTADNSTTDNSTIDNSNTHNSTTDISTTDNSTVDISSTDNSNTDNITTDISSTDISLTALSTPGISTTTISSTTNVSSDESESLRQRIIFSLNELRQQGWHPLNVE